MNVRGDFLGPPHSRDTTTLIIKVKRTAKIRSQYNSVPHMTWDTIWECDTNTIKHNTQASQDISEQVIKENEKWKVIVLTIPYD